jgi:hypothetical protein
MNTPQPTLSAHRILGYLGRAIAILGILHFVGLTLSCLTQSNAIIAAAKMVNLDRERNLPTLFNVCLFLLNAGLLLITYDNRRAVREPDRVWALLSGIFAFLALDEFGSIHEQLNQPMRNAFNLPGIFHFAWVIPYGILASIVGSIVFPTLLKLRPSVRKWFFIAPVVYISGAIGGQLLAAMTHVPVSETNFLYGCFVAFEELCEMSGLALFGYGLLRLIEQQYGSIAMMLSHHYGIAPQSYAAYQTDNVVTPGRRIEFSLSHAPSPEPTDTSSPVPMDAPTPPSRIDRP